MARRAFLLGGSGQTGRGLVPRLRERGWEVVVASRGEREVPEGVEHVRVDRADEKALRDAVGDGADVLTLEQLAQLLQVEETTLRSLAAKGDLPGKRLGRDWRFSRRAVLDWLATPERKRRVAGFEG